MLGGVLLMLGGTRWFRRCLGPVQRAWMGLAHAISKVTTPIFMGVVYFLVLTPIGLLRRALGRQAVARTRSASSWMTRHRGEPRG